MPTIRIPSPLRPYTGGNAAVVVSGETVGAALQDLTLQYPDLRNHLYAESGNLRPFVNIYLGEENVHFLRGVGTPVTETDQLRIVPSIAGGLDLQGERPDESHARVS